MKLDEACPSLSLELRKLQKGRGVSEVRGDNQSENRGRIRSEDKRIKVSGSGKETKQVCLKLGRKSEVPEDLGLVADALTHQGGDCKVW